MPKSIRSLFVAVAVSAFAGGPTASTSAPVRAAELAPRSSILSPNPSSSSNTLTDVSAVSATDAWAVGYYTDDATGATDTLIVHWDGTSWSQVKSPDPSSSHNTLSGVSAASAKDAWAVGSYDTARASDTLILHWNGTRWSQVKSPNPSSKKTNNLYSVSADSATDAWAVGRYRETQIDLPTLVLHWNGARWSEIDSPNPNPQDNHLLGVSANSAKDAWAVGYYLKRAMNLYRTLILHWNGTSWSKVKSPNPSSLQPYLYSVSANSANDAWAVGTYAKYWTFRTLTLHWDGTGWSRVDSPNPGRQNDLDSVSGIGPRNVWAVGNYYDLTTGVRQTLILHWDGKSWSQVDSPDPGSTENALTGVSADSATDGWAVGSYRDDTTGAIGTLILHWDGTSWSQV